MRGLCKKMVSDGKQQEILVLLRSKEAYLQPFLFSDLLMSTGSNRRLTPVIWELNTESSLCKIMSGGATRLLDETPQIALCSSFLGAFQQVQGANCTTCGEYQIQSPHAPLHCKGHCQNNCY